MTERESLLDVVSTADDGDWCTPSLWEGRPVVDVAARVVVDAERGPVAALAVVTRHRLSPTRAREHEIARSVAAGPDAVLEGLRASLPSRRRPLATSYAALAVDCAVAVYDVAVPLGRPHRPEPERLRWLLDAASRLGGRFGVRRRIAGLWLEATDVGWTHGTLPDGTARDRAVRDVMVSGPAGALLCAMFGRVAWLDHLAGHGVETLGSRA